MRIGFGKSYYANAVGMALGNPGDKQLFKKFIQTFNLGRRNQSVFPVTRTIDSAFNPLGWIKLTLNEV
jgi:CRISPR/Cas system CSM-associated protein Csm5 (group 7 of RAMP superfamily)